MDKKNELIYLDRKGNTKSFTPPAYGELVLKFQDGVLVSADEKTSTRFV